MLKLLPTPLLRRPAPPPRRADAMPPRRPAATGAETQAPAADGPVPDAGDTAAGCGWFDSSHALRTGLAVTEHASTDAVAGELPLSDWLALVLDGGRQRSALQ